MADFHQGGAIATLHRLGRVDVQRLERELLAYSRSRPIALVLPCLHSEIQGPGLKGIVDVLRGVDYLRQIVVSISGTDERHEYNEMREVFDGVTTLDGRAPVFCSGTFLQRALGAWSRQIDEHTYLGPLVSYTLVATLLSCAVRALA